MSAKGKEGAVEKQNGAVKQPLASMAEVWKAAKIKVDPNNARKHGKKQIAQLRSSWREYGQVWPLLVRPNGTLIAGHGRFEAGKAEGSKLFTVIVARGWTEERCRAFALLDNKIPLNASWDKDKLAVELAALTESGVDAGELGFNENEISKLLEDEAAAGTNESGASPTGSFQVVIDCASEVDRDKMIKKLTADGITARAQ